MGKHEHKGHYGKKNGSGSGSGTGGSAQQSASSTKSYHNGGVEGDSFSDWYDANLAGKMGDIGDSGSGAVKDSGEAQDDGVDQLLDLEGEGKINILNVTVDPDTGKISGSVEFIGLNGEPIAVGHFSDVSEIKLPPIPDTYGYELEDLDVIGDNVPGQLPKVSMDSYIENVPVDDSTPDGGTNGSGSGGTNGSGSGGTNGSGSGGSKGSGSGGSKGSGSGGSKGSGSGGSKGSGSGGSKGSGSGGSKGSGSGGSKGSGSGGSKGSGSGGSKGSGSGGSKGSGSGGSKGSGSGGSKGSGSGGSKGSGSGGSKGSGSGGSKGSGSGGSKGSGSGGSKGSGSGGSKDSGSGSGGSHTHTHAALPAYSPHPDDVMSLLNQDIDEDEPCGTQSMDASGETYDTGY